MDELVQCPYEPSHQILKSRLQVHLTKCRKNHKDALKVTCPFDTTHVLNEAELEWHVQNCPKRQNFERYSDKDNNGATAAGVLPVPQNVDDENWDEDPDVPTYNPQEYAKNANVLRSIPGATPSQKKEFRAKERLRLLGIKQDKQ